MIKRLFTELPASVDETYFEHLVAAGSFSLRTFSVAIETFYGRMGANRLQFEEGRLDARGVARANREA